jgi:hypothetical protein
VSGFESFGTLGRGRLQRQLARSQSQEQRAQRRCSRRALAVTQRALQPARTFRAAHIVLAWLARS